MAKVDSPLEELYILRVPDKLARVLREYIAHTGGEESKLQGVELEMQNQRTGTFRIGGTEHDVALVDLPCVTEVYKTVDKRAIYKTGDVHQVFCVRDPATQQTTGKNSSLKPAWLPGCHHYQLSSGITPPTHRIVSRIYACQPPPTDIERVEQIVMSLKSGQTRGTDEIVEIIDASELDDDDHDDDQPDPRHKRSRPDSALAAAPSPKVQRVPASPAALRPPASPVVRPPAPPPTTATAPARPPPSMPSPLLPSRSVPPALPTPARLPTPPPSRAQPPALPTPAAPPPPPPPPVTEPPPSAVEPSVPSALTDSFALQLQLDIAEHIRQIAELEASIQKQRADCEKITNKIIQRRLLAAVESAEKQLADKKKSLDDLQQSALNS